MFYSEIQAIVRLRSCFSQDSQLELLFQEIFPFFEFETISQKKSVCFYQNPSKITVFFEIVRYCL